MRPLLKIMVLFFAAILFCLHSAAADEGHHHSLTADEIGSVHFATSCQPAMATDFNRAVALLHSFQYEQARDAFTAISKADPECGMAHWGIAMTYYHGLWHNSDLVAGRLDMNRALSSITENDLTTARERAYIEALAEIYKNDTKPESVHAGAFAQKMASLHAAYPNDTEGAVFYALTLAITAPKADKTYSNQRLCGEILGPLFAQQPHHPGIPHYIIHCYDNPVLAEQGLKAARAYARIAPASAHAQHMPSHLFTRVGSWDESITANLKSAAMAAQAEATAKGPEARDQRMHAMDYLEYAYLQSGRNAEAAQVLAEMNALPARQGQTLTSNYAMNAIPARYTLEREKWKEASELVAPANGEPWAQAISWMAIGIGSARSGNLERARTAEQTLAWLRDRLATANPYWSKQVEVQRQEVAAWIIASSSGAAKTRFPAAITQMLSAANLEESMDKDAVTPGAVVPAREMLAELFLRDHKPSEALKQYEAVLSIAPNRFNALYGAAISAEQAGEGAKASAYFRKLTESAHGDERPELADARKNLASGGTP